MIVSLTSKQEKNIKTKLIYNKPIKAPIKGGQKVGKIIIKIPDKDSIEVLLLSKNDVKIVNPIFRIFSAINYLIFGNIYEE